ncbi:HDOD domain-containing protein [Sulfurimonas sp.]
MITKENVDIYIKKIPPAPDALKQTILFLNQGELTKASKSAMQDLALSSYLKDLVNRPIFGFKNAITDISQIFGILGVEKSQQAVYSYMISLLSPSQWKLFQLTKTSFEELQVELSLNWQKILKHLKIEDKSLSNAITLLPSSIIVAEALFCEKLEDVALLRSVNEIDLNTILSRLSGMDLFDICERIAQKWEMDDSVSELLQAASGVKPSTNPTINNLGKWMHLLLFYTLSKPIYIDAGLNDFIDFQIDYVEDIYNDFSQLMEIV